MNKKVKVNFQKQSGDYHSMQINYIVEQENDRVLSINCKIELPDNKLPDWLSSDSFTIRKVFSPGYPRVTATSTSPQMLISIDEASLRNNAEIQIMLSEKLFNRF